MENPKYPIEITSISGQGVPSIKADFGRITVLFGSNGTGKSRALKQIRGMTSNFGENNRPSVYIEGGRVISLPKTLTYDYTTYTQFGTIFKALSTYRNRRLSPLIERNKDIFYLLERRSESQKIKHSDAVSAWQADGSRGLCPTIEEDPLERLFAMFSEVFPEITLRIENEDKELVAYKNTYRYQVTELSDGERQVLFILADIALSAELNSLIIADEPELNLNSQLAGRLWDTIEGRLPEAVFVYGTHNVSFALRQSVECVVALSCRGAPAVSIKRFNDLAKEDARELLGAIPAILSAPAAIGVEGNSESFDRDFYTWLLKRTDVAIVPLGSCQDVLAAITRRGIWQELAPSVKLVGIIDRDYRSDYSLKEDSKSCLVLEYHEAESYLCNPEVIETIATFLGTMKQLPKQSDVMEQIIKFFNENMLRIVVNRMSEHAQVKLNVSLEYSSFKNITDPTQLCTLIGNEADKEAAKAYTIIGSDQTTKIFNRELQRCQQALSSKDLNELLCLCPGKELIHRLAPMAGCRDAAALARAIYKHLDPVIFPPLKALFESIQVKLMG